MRYVWLHAIIYNSIYYYALSTEVLVIVRFPQLKQNAGGTSTSEDPEEV